MIQDKIEQDILIDAPVDVVWKVVTEPDQIEQWFVDKAEIDVREGGAGKLTFVNQDQQTQTAHLQVESIQKPTRFAFKWGFTMDQELTPGKTVLVEFLLAAEGDKTRLTVIESGFQAVEWGDSDATQYIKEHTEGWAFFLQKLRDHAQSAATK